MIAETRRGPVLTASARRASRRALEPDTTVAAEQAGAAVRGVRVGVPVVRGAGAAGVRHITSVSYTHLTLPTKA